MTSRYCKNAAPMPADSIDRARKQDAVTGSRNLLHAILMKHGVAVPGRRDNA